MERLAKIFIFLVVAAFLAAHVQFVDDSTPSADHATPAIAPEQSEPGLLTRDLAASEGTPDLPQLILPDNEPFFDTADHWAQTSIGLIKSIGLCQGYPDGSFRPDQALNRLEALQLLMSWLETVNPADMTEICPVDETQIALLPVWGQAAGERAARLGIINLEEFVPDLPIERAMLVEWLAKISNGETVPVEELPFADADSFSPELAESLAGLYQQGIIKGYPDQKFHAQEVVSRADMMVILTRLLNAADPIRLTILSVNDFHGALVEAGDNPGAARLAAYINAVRARNPEGTVLLSGGDMLQSRLNAANFSAGETVIEVMNALDFAGMAIGNHEFDEGIEILEKRARQAVFPFLTCNIKDKQTGQSLPFTSPYLLLEKAGLKIGIIGFTAPATVAQFLPGIIDKYAIAEPSAAVNTLTRQLRSAGAQIIIVVGHAGAYLSADGRWRGEAALIAQSLHDVDVLITAHTHQQYAYNYYNMAVVQAGYNGRAVAEVELYYSPAAQKLYITSLQVNELRNFNLPEDATIQALIDGNKGQINPLR